MTDVLPKLRGPAFAGLVAFLFTLGVDLGSKALAVYASPPLRIVFDARHNGDLGKRLALGLGAVVVVTALGVAAQQRGVGQLWGSWIALGLLLGGIAGNGLSHTLWVGTPDFIWAPGSYVWNVADFAIGIGLAGIVLSTAVAALHAAWRDKRFA